MNRLQLVLSSLLLVFIITLTSCEAIAGIFKAGMGVGIFIVVLIVGLILYFVSRSRK